MFLYLPGVQGILPEGTVIMFRKYRYHINNYKFSIVSILIILATVGLVLIQKLQDADENQFERQLPGLLLGFLVMIVVSLIDYHFIAKMYILMYLANLAMMIICKFVTYNCGIPGSNLVYGWAYRDAKRWIKIGGGGRPQRGFEFMPSELTKIIVIVFAAQLLVKVGDRINRFWTLCLVMGICMLPIYLIYDQPDLSTSIVLTATFFCMVFLSGLTYKIVIPALAVGIPSAAGLFWYILQPNQKLIKNKYQINRILALQEPDKYPDLMYQQNQAAAAIESGGMFGKTIVGDTSNYAHYVPVVESDFIFAAVAEEFGFFGCILIVGLYLLMTFIGFRVAMNAKDRLGYLIAAGISIMLCTQTLVNIGVVVSLLPNTGIPLPFLSSGLSALLSNMITIGVLLNIGLQNKSTLLEKDRYEMNLNELLRDSK